MGVQEIRQRLTGLSAAHRFHFKTTRARDLALEKIRFAARLISVAGYAGWAVLFDEVELIGCYGLVQRAKSYAEIARFLGRLAPGLPGVVAAFAITDDFGAAVLYGKADLRTIPALGHIGYQDGTPAADAVAGMEALQQQGIALRVPTAVELQKTSERVMQLYTDAYGWTPPAAPPDPVVTSTRMRQYLKRWIYRWDLARLCQTSEAVESTELATSYTEVAAEDAPSGEDALMHDLVEALTSPVIGGRK